MQANTGGDAAVQFVSDYPRAARRREWLVVLIPVDVPSPGQRGQAGAGLQPDSATESTRNHRLAALTIGARTPDCGELAALTLRRHLRSAATSPPSQREVTA